MPSDTAGIWAIWHWPSTSGAAVKITNEEGLSDLQPEWVSLSTPYRTASGRAGAVNLGGFWRVRFVYELFTTTAAHDSLRSLEADLKRGSLCQIAANSVKAWGGFGQVQQRPGDTVIQTLGSPFPAGVTTAAGDPDVTLASGDQVVIQSVFPESAMEVSTISSHSGNKITLATALRYDYTPPVLVRHLRFFPAMRLAQEAYSRPLLIEDHGRVFTLDLLLEEDPAALTAYAQLGGTPLRTPSKTTGWTADAWTDKTAAGSSGGGGAAPQSGKFTGFGRR